MSTLAELERDFQKAVDAFNKRDLDDLSKYLSPQVSVYSINEHNGHYTKEKARAYFESQFADKPNFEMPEKPKFMINKAGNAAFITGQTTWTDTHSPGGEPLLYVFTFVYDSANSRWQFSTMWGAVN